VERVSSWSEQERAFLQARVSMLDIASLSVVLLENKTKASGKQAELASSQGALLIGSPLSTNLVVAPPAASGSLPSRYSSGPSQHRTRRQLRRIGGAKVV